MTTQTTSLPIDALFEQSAEKYIPVEVTIKCKNKISTFRMPFFVLDSLFPLSEHNHMADKYTFEFGLEKCNEHHPSIATFIARIMLGHTVNMEMNELICEKLSVHDWLALYKFIDTYFMPSEKSVINYITKIKEYVKNKVVGCMDTLIKAHELITKGPVPYTEHERYVDAARWLLSATKLDKMYCVHDTYNVKINAYNTDINLSYEPVEQKLHFVVCNNYNKSAQKYVDNLYALVREFAHVFDIFKTEWIGKDAIEYLKQLGIDKKLIEMM